jgi:hypothetical protein
LNRLSLIGTTVAVICTSTMSPILNPTGSIVENLYVGVSDTEIPLSQYSPCCGIAMGLAG